MLSDDKKIQSLENVRAFLESNGNTEMFNQKCYVSVKSDNKDYLYKNVTVIIYYDYNYADYKVEILWEEDESQIQYERLSLFGKYSSNFQFFTYSNGTLSFSDKGNQIIVYT